MNKFNVKVLFFVGIFAALLVLSGCGLNRRSASQSDPVPVEPIDVNVTDPTDGQPSGEEPTPTDGGSTDNPDNTIDPNTNEGEQPADGEGTGDSQGNTDGQDTSGSEGNTEPENPREEEPSTEQPADGQDNTDPNAEDPGTSTEPTPIPPTPVPATETPSTGTTDKHIVQAGQTLFSIAQLYGLTVQELAAANGIANPNILDVGQELTIPAAGTVQVPDTTSVHVVSYGETIYSIALRYGVTVEALALHNNLENVNRIDVGQEIKIPSGDGK